jgi:hypothetical protein
VLLIGTGPPGRTAGRLVVVARAVRLFVRGVRILVRLRTAAPRRRIQARGLPGCGCARGGAAPRGTQPSRAQPSRAHSGSGRRPPGQPIRGAAGKTLSGLGGSVAQERRRTGIGLGVPTLGRGQPRRRRRPVTGRIAPRSEFVGVVVAIGIPSSHRRGLGSGSGLGRGRVILTGRRRGCRCRGRTGCRRPGSGCSDSRAARGRRGIGGVAGPGRLSTSPVLERGAHRESARQAIGLLVSEGPRSRTRLGVAAVSMVGNGCPFVTVVLERHERTRGRAVREGQSAFSHRPMIPARSVVGPRPWTASASSGRR